jgi:hypothetical protein
LTFFFESMLIIFVFSLFVLILIHPDFATNASPASSENESRSEEVIQCKCVAYYHCHEVNKFMILSRTRYFFLLVKYVMFKPEL